MTLTGDVGGEAGSRTPMRLLADNKWVYIKLILSSPFEGGQTLVIYLKAILTIMVTLRTALRYVWGGGNPVIAL